MTYLGIVHMHTEKNDIHILIGGQHGPHVGGGNTFTIQMNDLPIGVGLLNHPVFMPPMLVTLPY